MSGTSDKPTYRVPCSTESVGYRIVCLTCKQQGKLATYEGETGRPAKVRFSEHIKNLQKNSEHSPLFKHQNNYHPGGSNKWHFLTQKLLICLFCQAQPQLQLQLSWRLSWLYSHVYTATQPPTPPPRRV